VTDWVEIADLYGALLRIHDSPVVRLNRAVAVAMAEDPEAGLRLIDDVAVELEAFHPLHAARADLLRRGRHTEAAAAYARAIAVCANDVETSVTMRSAAAFDSSPRTRSTGAHIATVGLRARTARWW